MKTIPASSESQMLSDRFGLAQSVFKPATAASEAASRSKPPVELMAKVC